MLLQVLFFRSPGGRLSGKSWKFWVLGQEPKAMACLGEGRALKGPCGAGAHRGTRQCAGRAGAAASQPGSLEQAVSVRCWAGPPRLPPAGPPTGILLYGA